MIRLGIAAATIASMSAIQPADAQRTCRQDCTSPLCAESCLNGDLVIERDRPVSDGRVLRHERSPNVLIEQRIRSEGRTEFPRPGVEVDLGIFR